VREVSQREESGQREDQVFLDAGVQLLILIKGKEEVRHIFQTQIGQIGEKMNIQKGLALGFDLGDFCEKRRIDGQLSHFGFRQFETKRAAK
jgi:hypothetical protein